MPSAALKVQVLLRPFFMALALLTRIPVAKYVSQQWLPHEWQDKDLGRSALWYPVVGVVIASILMLAICLLPSHISPWVAAIFLLVLWVGTTGALHLDGVADCVDAMYAGHSVPNVLNESNDKTPKIDKVLKVLKDPTIGAMAVIALVIVLMSKTILLASLWILLDASIILPVIFSISIARVVALLFMVYTPYTPYASQQGLGAVIAMHTPQKIALLVSSIFGVALCVCFVIYASWLMMFVALLTMTAVFYFWRSYWVKTLGGFVGDAIGCFIEIMEVVILFLFYCALL
jgi:adenosylcobinamide-GDP ribazoletransferase